MREQFDRIVYILEKELDIKIGLNAAKKMLTTYIQSKAWLYPLATYNNLPWMFGYFSWAKSLYGQAVLKDSPLYKAIIRSCPNVEFTQHKSNKNYEVLGAKKGKWININYCLLAHKRSVVDDIASETIEIIVWEDLGEDKRNKFFNKKLTIDEKCFNNLISLSEERSKRNVKLLEIAKEVMPELP